MSWKILQEDVLIALQEFERRGEKFDAVVMDPPYCSGGLLPAQIARDGVGKYSDAKNLGDFEDGMSSITFYRFLIEVFTRTKRVLKSPGYVFSFIDWRMYPVVFEAMERGGSGFSADSFGISSRRVRIQGSSFRIASSSSTGPTGALKRRTLADTR